MPIAAISARAICSRSRRACCSRVSAGGNQTRQAFSSTHSGLRGILSDALRSSRHSQRRIAVFDAFSETSSRHSQRRIALFEAFSETLRADFRIQNVPPTRTCSIRVSYTFSRNRPLWSRMHAHSTKSRLIKLDLLENPGIHRETLNAEIKLAGRNSDAGC
jgi:hypothetical protein